MTVGELFGRGIVSDSFPSVYMSVVVYVHLLRKTNI